MSSQPLATPTIVVRYLHRNKPTTPSRQKIHSYHFGLTSALRTAATLPRAWIEGKDRATLLTPSRSPSVRARGLR